MSAQFWTDTGNNLKNGWNNFWETINPTYDSSKWEAASNTYNSLVEQYTGENGQKKASEQARKEADQAARTAGATVMQNALNAGYGRAKAARMASAANAKQYNDSYTTGYNNASSMNNAMLNANSQNISNQKELADAKYNAKRDISDRIVGGAESVLDTASNIASKIPTGE